MQPYHRQPGEPIIAGRGVTPAAEVDAACARIVETWNRCIPRNHVRIVHAQRYREMAELLNLFPVADIVAGIEYYGRQDWQRQRNAWATFDAFLGRAVNWIEQALDDAERRERLKPPPPKVAALAGNIGRQPPPPDPLAGVPDQQRRPLMSQARAELLSLGRLNPTDYAIRQQAAVILSRTAKQGDDHG